MSRRKFGSRKGDEIIPIINKISKSEIFDKIVATQDWHPKNHMSFASNQGNHHAYDIINTIHGIDVLWPDHCVKGTPGAEFHPDLYTIDINLIIRKGSDPKLDSYSTFLENDENTPTGLAGYLREHNIEEVYICGIATDVCVYNSAIDAVHFGFDTYVIEDASAGVDVPAGSLEKAKNDMLERGVKFIHSENLGLKL